MIENETALLELARRLPVKDDEKNLKRILHANKFGHVVILKENDRIVGYAEGYRMSYIPDYPVRPWPIDEPEGEYLYCFAAVCEPWRIKDLINAGFNLFPNVKWIIYHRHRHQNKLYKIGRR